MSKAEHAWFLISINIVPLKTEILDFSYKQTAAISLI